MWHSRALHTQTCDVVDHIIIAFSASLHRHAMDKQSWRDMSQMRTLLRRQLIALCRLRLPHCSFGIKLYFSACCMVRRPNHLLFMLYAATISLMVCISSTSVTPIRLKSSKSSMMSCSDGEKPISNGTVHMMQSTSRTCQLYVPAM